jgi:hypothetical protein
LTGPRNINIFFLDILFFFWTYYFIIQCFFFLRKKKLMNRTLEDDSCCTRATRNNENLVDNNLSEAPKLKLPPNQKFVIEIDDNDEDDLEILCSDYPSVQYEISSFDKIIKDETNNNNNASAQSEAPHILRTKTYKLTITKRNSNQQRLFRNELLKHYKTCIISGVAWDVLLDAAHIMPFKEVGSYLSTGFLLTKDLHWLWDRFHISINPKIWTVVFSEQASISNYYSEYNNFKLPDKVVTLLKEADIQVLKQHYDKFKEIEHSRKHQIRDKAGGIEKRSDKEVIARFKNQQDIRYDEFITEPGAITTYYDEFISQIWNNDPAPTWYKPEKKIPKNGIYSAFVEFNNKKNGKQQSTDNETNDNDDDNAFRPEKQKVFWQNMYKVICEPNGKAKMKIGGKTVYYVCLFPKDIIIQNVRKLNGAEIKTKEKQQIPQQKSLTGLRPGNDSRSESLIKHNITTINDSRSESLTGLRPVNNAVIKSKENNSNKKRKEIEIFQKERGESPTKKLKLSPNEERQIDSMKEVAELNNADRLKEKATLQKTEKPSKKTLKTLPNNKLQINRNSPNNNNTLQTNVLSLSNEVDDLGNEQSSYIDEIEIDDLESFEFAENILVDKESIRKNDKERMINCGGDTIGGNNINNDEEHI